MKLVLLGGMSLKNKGWIEEVRDELKRDFEVEGRKLEKMCLGECAVLAKSAGGWLTVKLAVAEKGAEDFGISTVNLF